MKHIPDWFEGAAVDRRWPQLAQASKVLLSAIAFVVSQPIARIDAIKLRHQMVTGYFGNDGGTGDREAQAITICYSFLR